MSVNEAILAPREEAPSPEAARSIGRAISVAAVVIVAAVVVAVVSFFPARQAVEPAGARNNPDAVLRDLVNRGLIPSQALERSQEQILRDLANRGLIPSQALDN